MLFFVLWFHAAGQVLSEVPPAPPQNVHVNNWLLTWTPTMEEGDVTHTVQYRSFDSSDWEDVPACVHISLNTCDVSSTKAKGEHGCVMLHVQAERRGLTSRPVKACSRHGDACTPELSLTARPGSLTVDLSRNHSLALEHGDHAKHRVYYGKEGELLQKYKDAVSSVTIPELEEGQRYCAKVQYTYFNKPIGLASCTQCEVIPDSRNDPKQTEIIVAVVVVVVLILLIPVIAYILIFQRERIKHWLRPPYEIPLNILPEPFSEHRNPIYSSSPTREECDVISLISPEK